MLEQKITLRAKTVGFQPVIKTSQGDTGRKLLCSFEDFTIPDSSTAKIYVLKPSGKSVQNDATISDQTITVELTNQILAEKGIVACQVQIINSGKAIKSFPFSLDNERSLAGDWPESENENTFLEGVVSEMQAKLTETINLANAAISAANTATQDAKNATANANAAADEARQAVWNNKNLTNSTSASESQVETAAGAAVLTGVDGKTEQVTTTGAQLLDVRTKVPITPANIFLSFSGNGEITINGTAGSTRDIYFFGTYGNTEPVIKEGNVTIKVEGATDDETIYLLKGTASVNSKGTQSATYNDVASIMFRLKQGKVYSNFKIKPMVNAGSEPLPWEPYTGGIPGPNPDYPIPIQGVGGETGDESFGFSAVIQGYQLFDASKIPTKSAGGATVTNNDDGSFTISGSGKLSSEYYNVVNIYEKNIKSMLKEGTITIKVEKATNPRTIFQIYNKGLTNPVVNLDLFTTSEKSLEIKKEHIENIDRIVIGFVASAGTDITPTTIKPILYQDGDGTWEPYHRSELPITLTHPLFEGDKIMQVKAGQTYLDADGATQTADRDLWGIERSSFIVNGNEKRFIINKAWTDRNEKFIFGYITDYSSYTKQGNILCNALPYHYFGVAPENVTEECVQTLKETSGVPLYVAINRERVDSIDQTGIETYMKTANMIFVMNYTTPRFIPFADQTPFLGWTTPTGGCTITTDDLLEPIISADTAQTPEGSYLLTGYVDGLRGRTLEQRILELEKNAIQEV